MTGRKYCSICGMEVAPTYPEHMEHFLKKHPNHKLVMRWKAKVKAEHRCAECGSTFNWRYELTMHDGKFYAPMYCEKCIEKNPYRMLFITKVELEETEEKGVR